MVFPGLILPGQRAMPGTLWPPSHVVPLPQRSRPPFPPLIRLVSEGLQWMPEYVSNKLAVRLCGAIRQTHPLSAVKKTSVLSSTPEELSVSSTCPTAQSISVIESPNIPLIVVFVNFSLANCGWCVCWKARYRKNGFPEAAESSTGLNVAQLNSADMLYMHLS